MQRNDSKPLLINKVGFKSHKHPRRNRHMLQLLLLMVGAGEFASKEL